MRAAAKPSLAHWDVCLGGRRCHRFVKHIAPAPYRFDVVIAARRLGELFAQLADENINDLELGLARSAIEGVEKHFPRDDGTFSPGEEFEDGVLLAGQVHRLVVDRDNSGIEIDDQLTDPDRRPGMALGTLDDGLSPNWMMCFEPGQARLFQAIGCRQMWKGSAKLPVPADGEV